VSRFGLAAVLAALILPASAAAFVPADPLAANQWYIAQDHAFDFWQDVPVLPPVKVAVIDSGIDLGHPEFAGRIAAVKSFVGDGVTDTDGHGTFVAGEIAALAGNGEGIVGIALPAQLIVAKVVQDDGSIAPDVEARAVRWAVAQGARVINLSIGGLRDPLDVAQDTYSAAEQDAIEYAYAHGAVVVAAVGNADQAPRTPWSFASYPAALPHVIGVAALAEDGTVPLFSNRDPIYADLAAPGQAIYSTLPRALTAARPGCINQGYSDCGPLEFRSAEGTSFAAPQVAAAAALLLATHPSLTPDLVARLIEHSAHDIGPAGRDSLTGWGRLDIAAALALAQGPLPAADRYESNDDAGLAAATLYGKTRQIVATLDYWDDPVDVYRVKLQAGETISAALKGPLGTRASLVLWKPGTEHVTGPPLDLQTNRATQSARVGGLERFTYRAPVAGWYSLEVKMATPGLGSYTLRYVKTL
jgi:subtilisin family serine protease